MKISGHELYHVYNQGNNREKLFYAHVDYIRFLHLYRKLVLPHCELLAYCLMPNHFHFLIYSDDRSVIEKSNGALTLTNLTNGMRLLQSSYTQYLNQQRCRTGSLFRQRAKFKSLSHSNGNYGMTAFCYIHHNPVSAGLSTHAGEWAFSSYQDYAALRNGTLCNRVLASQLLGFEDGIFLQNGYGQLDDALLKEIW